MLFKSKYYKVDNTNDELLNKIEKWDLEYVMAEIGENFTFQEILILELYKLCNSSLLISPLDTI